MTKTAGKKKRSEPRLMEECPVDGYTLAGIVVSKGHLLSEKEIKAIDDILGWAESTIIDSHNAKEPQVCPSCLQAWLPKEKTDIIFPGRVSGTSAKRQVNPMSKALHSSIGTQIPKITYDKSSVILDLCGGTGSWSKPYKDAGYDVRVATLPDFDVTDWRNSWLSELVFEGKVYGILSAPPCTQFSFCRTNAKEPRCLMDGMGIVEACLDIIWQCQFAIKKDTQKYSPLKFWALENPNRGMLKWFLGKPAFVFQPYEFGDDYKKETALWGMFNEPKKNPIVCTKPKFDRLSTKEIHPEYYGKYDRTTRRSITPKGFAEAFYKANP